MNSSERPEILDMTCGSRSIWFNKRHPATVYCDQRREHDVKVFGTHKSHHVLDVDPDILCDFTDLPFEDESFSMVVFDPPHLKDIQENSWLVRKYGKLGEDWPRMLRDGFREGMRVLKPNGVMIFKWNEHDIPTRHVWDAIGERPLFGHHSGKRSQTFWGVFMKGHPYNEEKSLKVEDP